jgi:hypothetical protein
LTRVALTTKQLNRATLARQMLLRRERLPVAEAVRRVVALQAQEPASPYIAMWNRLAAFDPADLDRAFTDYAVVKATLMRITLHAVHAEDYPAFHEAMVANLRGSRLGDRRFTSTGHTVAEVDELMPHLLEHVSEPRTVPEIEAMLSDRLGAASAHRVWWALRTFAPLVHVPTGGWWSFNSGRSFLAAPEKPPPQDREQSLQRLFWRYLEGFGPASTEDFAQGAIHYQTLARTALEGIVDKLTRFEGPDGVVLYDVPDAPRPPEDTPAPPRLLPMWDSILLAHRDRTRILPTEYRQLVTRSNGDVLPTLLVDGYVSGVWRPVDEGIEATAFHPLPDDVWEALATEARSLVALLADREPAVYRRYQRWWSTLPVEQVGVLPG